MRVWLGFFFCCVLRFQKHDHTDVIVTVTVEDIAVDRAVVVCNSFH